MDDREMYDEISALVGAVGKALDISDIDAITAIEQGRLTMEMLTDDDGQNYVQVACDGRTARVYPGAIFREGDHTEADAEEDCGGGCSCGH